MIQGPSLECPTGEAAPPPAHPPTHPPSHPPTHPHLAVWGGNLLWDQALVSVCKSFAVIRHAGNSGWDTERPKAGSHETCSLFPHSCRRLSSFLIFFNMYMQICYMYISFSFPPFLPRSMGPRGSASAGRVPGPPRNQTAITLTTVRRVRTPGATVDRLRRVSSSGAPGCARHELLATYLAPSLSLAFVTPC